MHNEAVSALIKDGSKEPFVLIDMGLNSLGDNVTAVWSPETKRAAQYIGTPPDCVAAITFDEWKKLYA